MDQLRPGPCHLDQESPAPVPAPVPVPAVGPGRRGRTSPGAVYTPSSGPGTAAVGRRHPQEEERVDESAPPWGTCTPTGLLARLLAGSRALPPTPLGARGARILRTLARAGRPGRPVDVELWGLRVRLHSRGNVSEARILFMPQLWEPGERALLRERARPGFVFLDVGANAGGYSLWVLGLLGSQCRIVAVEPDPVMHARLRFNAQTNGAEHLRVLQVAVSDREGEGVLHR